ncbi:TMEM175 family protein [Lacisediminihabitans changchengi]|uniref:DUF1211 domain-containing protein n=1 Tax=Lacisediminihabitans changchengi TaxID=2787634 RepID=A0A934SJA2_9MICO|nr:TMEM175 family protein [Lacisediminihabitans changchengi]MBK4346389.1 DUF1211 domain-containing protein [Lacisediminihabitans changchengi]
MTNIALTPRAHRSIGRLTAFSDGVVSIAATLLVLPLVDTAVNENLTSFSEFFAKNGSQVLVLTLSFTVILRFWLIHHALFDGLVAFTPPLFWVNALWLLSIVFIPFPTQLIAGKASQSPTIDAIYIGTMFVTSLSGLMLKVIISRHPEILSADAGSTTALGASVVAVVTMGVALVLALVVPGVGLWALLLLFVDIPIQRVLDRRHRRTRSIAP